MTQATVSRVRRTVRVFALVAPIFAVLVLAGACGEQKRAEGDDCLKDEDCLSGYCVQLQCGSAPPLTDAEVFADVVVTDGATGSKSDASDATPGDDGQTGGGMDAPADSPGADDTGTGGGG